MLGGCVVRCGGRGCLGGPMLRHSLPPEGLATRWYGMVWYGMVWCVFWFFVVAVVVVAGWLVDWLFCFLSLNAFSGHFFTIRSLIYILWFLVLCFYGISMCNLCISPSVCLLCAFSLAHFLLFALVYSSFFVFVCTEFFLFCFVFIFSCLFII